MKVIILVFFLFYRGAEAACLSAPPVSLVVGHVDLRYAEKVVLDFEQTMTSEIPSHYSLVVNLEPLNPRINADVNKQDYKIIINLMGGILRHSKMTSDALVLLLCHELGHFLGGAPYKSRNGWSATEGQADYYSAYSCARKFFLDDEAFIKGSLALTTIYSDVTRNPPPRLDTCDELKVQRTNYGYPSVQCRLDTLMAGWRKLPRPACWFYHEE